MAGIGHNKASHQLETVELEGIPVTLYKRSDHNDPKWQMRIKVLARPNTCASLPSAKTLREPKR